ncbi:MAG: rod shape-determining protein MreD [Lachnospiraceae bacterium]|nr:rod shape-determining protein MreD [Lachnospiraceae bacterium]MDN4742637.1 rod shape-determining protein MreD [Lachnospiraceae bacterium C1.1]
MRRKIIEFLIIFISFIIQCTFFKAVNMGGISPNLLIIVTATFGFIRGQREGMYVGFLAGLFTDILFGNGIIGLYTLIYTFVGYLNGLFSRIFYPEDVKLPIFLIIVSDFIYSFICYILTFLLRSRLDLPFYLIHVMIPELVYTALITLIFYRFILIIEKVIEEKEEME